jgi:hypothetical protein
MEPVEVEIGGLLEFIAQSQAHPIAGVQLQQRTG